MQIGVTFLQFNNSCHGLDKTTFDGLGFGGWNQGNWGIFNGYTCLDKEDIRSSTNMIPPPPLFRRDVITNSQLCNLFPSFLKYYVLDSQDASPLVFFVLLDSSLIRWVMIVYKIAILFAILFVTYIACNSKYVVTFLLA